MYDRWQEQISDQILAKTCSGSSEITIFEFAQTHTGLAHDVTRHSPLSPAQNALSRRCSRRLKPPPSRLTQAMSSLSQQGGKRGQDWYHQR